MSNEETSWTGREEISNVRAQFGEGNVAVPGPLVLLVHGTALPPRRGPLGQDGPYHRQHLPFAIPCVVGQGGTLGPVACNADHSCSKLA